jgi:hypothetical protein
VKCFLVAARRVLIAGRRMRLAYERRLLAATLLVEGENLQLDREIDLAHLDFVGNGEDDRCKVKDAADTGGDQTIADILRNLAGGRDNSDGSVTIADD